MNALFEDGGKFHAGRVMSETDASLQIELASGKRSKVKAANVLLRFAAPEPEALLGAAERIAAEIDAVTVPSWISLMRAPDARMSSIRSW